MSRTNVSLFVAAAGAATLSLALTAGAQVAGSGAAAAMTKEGGHGSQVKTIDGQAALSLRELRGDSERHFGHYPTLAGGTIFDNGAPDGGNGLSNFEGTLIIGGVPTDFDRVIADDFELTSTVTIEAARMSGVWFDGAGAPGPLAALRVRIYENAGGQPGAVICDVSDSAFDAELTGGSFFGRPEVMYQACFDCTLDAGTYWISIQPTGTTDNFFQLTSATGFANLFGEEAHIQGDFDPPIPPPNWEPGSSTFDDPHDVTFELLAKCEGLEPPPPPDACIDGVGDCCAAQTGSPGCEDEACCTLICLQDAFCCNTNWDGLCASAANDLCEVCEVEPDCGVDGTGDCCVANGTPFCDDEACCDLICDQDPFCCDTEWDGACADAANEQCAVCDVPGCGDPGTGDCCEAQTGSPFCENAACCECICACDPFCCNTNWDSLCAGMGIGGCGASNPDGPCADECSECLPVLECGSDIAGDCCEANGSPFCDDEACCDLICDQDPFCCDTEWDGACADAANDQCEVCDVPGCGDEGTGDCCEAMPPGSGSPFCEDEACCELICAQDSFCCNVNWDSLCANAANDQCEVCQPDPEGCSLGFWKNHTDQWVGYDPDDLFSDVFATTIPPESDCCEAQVGSPGCDDPDCEAAVCAVDPFCCNVNWDSLCASQAVNDFCVELCEETSAGVEVFNECTLLDVISSPSGGPMACSGTPQANNLGKQAVAALLNASSAVAYPLSEQEVIDAVVAAFEAWLDGAHHSVLNELKDQLDEFNNIGCPEFNTADINADGYVNGADLMILLQHWGSDSEESRHADLNGDGIVDGTDLLILLENWGEHPPSWDR